MLSTLRLAALRLAKTPWFAITALSTLAICIGANLAIFAVVDGIVLRPLPFPSADRLVLVTNSYPGAGVDVFAAVALLLAAIGTYGVLSYAVQQRWREIGMRMALGASPEQIRNQFLTLDASLLAVGLGLGIMGALGASWAMRAILFGVPSLPVGTLAVTALIMTAVSLTACLLPAKRATRADPMDALRSG